MFIYLFIYLLLFFILFYFIFCVLALHNPTIYKSSKTYCKMTHIKVNKVLLFHKLENFYSIIYVFSIKNIFVYFLEPFFSRFLENIFSFSCVCFKIIVRYNKWQITEWTQISKLVYSIFVLFLVLRSLLWFVKYRHLNSLTRIIIQNMCHLIKDIHIFNSEWQLN